MVCRDKDLRAKGGCTKCQHEENLILNLEVLRSGGNIGGLRDLTET